MRVVLVVGTYLRGLFKLNERGIHGLPTLQSAGFGPALAKMRRMCSLCVLKEAGVFGHCCCCYLAESIAVLLTPPDGTGLRVSQQQVFPNSMAPTMHLAAQLVPANREAELTLANGVGDAGIGRVLAGSVFGNVRSFLTSSKCHITTEFCGVQYRSGCYWSCHLSLFCMRRLPLLARLP